MESQESALKIYPTGKLSCVCADVLEKFLFCEVFSRLNLLAGWAKSGRLYLRVRNILLSYPQLGVILAESLVDKWGLNLKFRAGRPESRV